MDRLSDNIKAVYEDETLGFFMTFRRRDAGVVFEFVEPGERPDRRIQDQGGGTPVIGVEITRIVEAPDAIAQSDAYHHGSALISLFEAEEPHGVAELYAGDWPDMSRDGTAAVVQALRNEIQSAGGVRAFIEGLDNGFWDYPPGVFGGCRYCFRLKGDGGWRTHANAVHRPLNAALPEDALDSHLVDRVRDKARKIPTYEWDEPMFLLVRNTYQAYTPSTKTLDVVRGLLDGIVSEAWLVNCREGVLDASPPRPRLVRLV